MQAPQAARGKSWVIYLIAGALSLLALYELRSLSYGPSQLGGALTSEAKSASAGGVNSPLSDIGSSFFDVAVVASTDKVTPVGGTGGRHPTHAYEFLYEKYLGHVNRATPLQLLEIGLGYGMPPPHDAGSSLKLWRSYFPNAAISFIELNEPTAEQFRKDIEASGGSVFIGSQSDPALIRQVLKTAAKFGGYDLIIDDGGHIPQDQRKTFEGLWAALRPGGVYIVEDLLTSYWEEYSNVKDKEGVIELIKTAIDEMNCHGVMPDRNSATFKKFCSEPRLGKSFLSLDCSPEICAMVKAREEEDIAAGTTVMSKRGG